MNPRWWQPKCLAWLRRQTKTLEALGGQCLSPQTPRHLYEASFSMPHFKLEDRHRTNR
jgi:hypothetical protein